MVDLIFFCVCVCVQVTVQDEDSDTRSIDNDEVTRFIFLSLHFNCHFPGEPGLAGVY